MLRVALLLLSATLIQFIYAKGQKPGTMNEYDEETNTVFDEPPEDESFLGWLEDLVFEEDYGEGGKRHHGSANAGDKHGEEWRTVKTTAKWIIGIIILLLLIIVGYLARLWWKKR